MTDKKVLPILSMLFTVIVWGLSFLSIKVVIDIIPPVTLGFLRFAIASVLLLFVVKLKGASTKLDSKDIPFVILSGFTGITLYFIFENNGVKELPASTASLIIATIPIVTLITDTIVLKTKLTRLKLISVLISFIGVYFIVGSDLKDLMSGGSITGYLYMLGAVLTWVIYALVTKPVSGKYSQMVLVYYQSVFGALLFVPFMIYEVIFIETPKWYQVTGSVALNILYLGIFCSAVGYITYVYGLKHLGVSISSIYLNAIPLVTVVASVFILNEEITLYKAVGGLLVIISVTMANWKKKTNKDTINISKENNKVLEN
ncbi:DMT family transporter [Dethiothermospora halolimnae]|uniref:DMT family transporter n=1 Tax=Dethiothermospora halolimnae TaxID=3114390 RepID=UPI003CCC2D96